MNRRAHRWLALVAAAAVCAGAGCAGLPRIDPTGERILLWPKDQPKPAAIALVPSNVTAPPVVTDPVFPAPPQVAAPAPPAGVMPVQAVSAVTGDKMTITPARVLAPVGSEVVLKSSICTTEGYTLADQKVEWTLGRNGVGEFVELGGKGLFHPPLIPFFRGKKIDNYLAEGYTANGPLCINRGTADPSDDVNINRGDAWISVTAAHEGTSYVTAMSPTVDSWNDRKAAATIYWVDVQWVFPPSTVASSGRAQTLVTSVTRPSDGTPVEGYLVRYEVASGGGVVSGGAGGQVVEVRTGGDGRATVEVSPTAAGAPSSQINVQLVRPAGYGGGDSPRLIVANGTTLVRWTGDSTPYLQPNTTTPGTPLPGVPLPSTPYPGTSTPQPGTTQTPMPGSSTVPNIPNRAARLEVDVTGPQQAEVGSDVRFQITVRNTGDGPATGIIVLDEFDRGLSNLGDTRAEQRIQSPAIGTLQAGESHSLFVSFTVNAPGQLCQVLTITSAEGVSAERQRACITAVAAAVARRPGIRVNVDGQVFAIVGQPTQFVVTVTNTGETPLANVELREEYPTALFRIRSSGDQNLQIVDGRIRRVIGRMERGAVRRFDVECMPLRETSIARVVATANADSEPPTSPITNSGEHEMEIRPATNPGGLGTGAAAAPVAGQGLSVTAAFLAAQTSNGRAAIRAGTGTTLKVTVQNMSEQLDEGVELRVTFPPEMAPDVGGVQGPPGSRAQLVGNELRVTPVAMARGREEIDYLIPVVASRTGIVEVISRAGSKNQRQPAERRTPVEILQ